MSRKFGGWYCSKSHVYLFNHGGAAGSPQPHQSAYSLLPSCQGVACVRNPFPQPGQDGRIKSVTLRCLAPTRGKAGRLFWQKVYGAPHHVLEYLVGLLIDDGWRRR